MPSKTRWISGGKSASTWTWYRRMSMSRGTFSMNTGHARSHQPHVVQAHTVSAFKRAAR